MNRALKWSGIAAAVAAGTMLGLQVISVLRRRVDRSLAQMEQITEDARQAMEKTAEALKHTEDAVRHTRRTVS
jgi:hypothetical protein